jgi:hypothetical protein
MDLEASKKLAELSARLKRLEQNLVSVMARQVEILGLLEQIVKQLIPGGANTIHTHSTECNALERRSQSNHVNAT